MSVVHYEVAVKGNCFSINHRVNNVKSTENSRLSILFSLDIKDHYTKPCALTFHLRCLAGFVFLIERTDRRSVRGVLEPALRECESLGAPAEASLLRATPRF